MFDLKTINLILDQIEEEKKIPREKMIEVIEHALAVAYKKDYGKKEQIVRAKFNLETGDLELYQVKIVVDPKNIYFDEKEKKENDERIRFDPEKHILLEEAQKVKSDVQPNEELYFPLETKKEFGRIAAQTAKQVIIQKIREAEKESILEEFSKKKGEIVSGIIQKYDRGNVYVDFGRTTGILPEEEQIPGEYYRQGSRIRAYLFDLKETPQGIIPYLSRTHPRFIERLFALESPEVASGVVEIKAIVREPGSRSKIAVYSNDENVDPIGSCVGQKGVRVVTVMNELSGEKIDIIPWSSDPAEFIKSALLPAKVLDIEIDEKEHKATIEVSPDQLSLAIGKGGQNVRLAARLTGWKIDIKGAPESLIYQEENLEEEKEEEEEGNAKEEKEKTQEEHK